MHPRENQRLRVLHAKWTLQTLYPEDVPEISQLLISEGLDSQTLRKLAGLPADQINTVPQLLPRLFGEMNLEERTKIEAAWLLVHEYATQVQKGRMGAYEGARRMGQFGTDFDPLYPYLRQFIAATEEWDEYPEHSQALESKIRTAAAAVLQMQPPPTPGKGSEVDRLVKIASNGAKQDHTYNKNDAAMLLAKVIPAGHVMNGTEEGNWTAIGAQQDMLILLLHSKLRFAIVRWEFEKFIQSQANKLGVLYTSVPHPDSKVLSLTHESVGILSGKAMEDTLPLRWLSLNDLRRMTETH